MSVEMIERGRYHRHHSRKHSHAHDSTTFKAARSLAPLVRCLLCAMSSQIHPPRRVEPSAGSRFARRGLGESRAP